MSNSKLHTELKNKVMIELQKKYLSRIMIHSRSVGLAYFKRNERYVGPFKLGEKGLSDIYGDISMPKHRLSAFFCIEVKTGEAVLSKDQKKHRMIDERRGCGFFIARDINIFMKEFNCWVKSTEA